MDNSQSSTPATVPGTGPAPAPRRSMPRRLFLLGVLLVAVALLAAPLVPVLFRSEPPPPERQQPADPRVSYRGPFRNVHPEVKYAGMEKCASCHAEIAETYVHAPMARAFLSVAELAAAQPYDKVNNNPFKALDSLFTVERRGSRVFHRETRPGSGQQPAFDTKIESQFAIGSGNHGHSYLCFLGDGYLFQTPISWFAQRKIWDISPGFTAVNKLRPVNGACLFCHANLSFPKEDTLNQFAPPFIAGHAIGCERCHGPGERHVEERQFQRVSDESRPFLREQVNRIDVTIVHPGKLRPDLREAVCQQCHLEGETRVLVRGRGLYDYRPGMPLEDFVATFVHARETGLDKKAVNHVEQMYLSRCFERSRGDNKLGCISCHNPHEHVRPEHSVAHYRDRCLRCHTLEKRSDERIPCSLSLASRRKKNQDNCYACHMPRYSTSDIAHAASTDHRIVRTPRPHDQEPHGPGQGAGLPLAHFHRGKVNLQDKEMSRDFGIALLQAIPSGKANPRLAPFAIDVLEKALVDFPDDVAAWESKAAGLYFQQRFAESLAASETVLTKSPNRENSLRMAAISAQRLRRTDLAIDYWQRAVALNPWISVYRDNLARLLASRGDWKGVLTHARHWLKLDPANELARKTWLEALQRTGFRGDPGAEFLRLSRAEPDSHAGDSLTTRLHLDR